jgi:polyferredoxin
VRWGWQSTRRGPFWTAAGARRAVQIAFLLLFGGLLLAARRPVEGDVSPLVGVFFHFDPLILIATWLAAHALYAGAFWALATILLTVVAGRVFCGWICPLGTLHAAAGRLLLWVWPRRAAPQQWSRWQLAKYLLLIGFLAMAVFGAHWGCVFDPLVLLYRTAATALLPASQWAVEAGTTAVFQADPGIGPARLTAATEPAYAFLRDHVFVAPKQAFLGGSLILGLFAITLLANRYRPRFWCRYLCPLGALLGLFAWRPWLRRRVREEDCNGCGLCLAPCHGAAATVAPSGAPARRGAPQGWLASECFGCMSCTEACRRDAVGFGWTLAGRGEQPVESIDLSKRAVLGAAVGGVASLGLFHISPQSRGRTFHPQLIRPPGARPEPEFLARCTSCGLCMKVCPTGGLQPALFEAGLEGLWTPRLTPRIGYCDYNCTACGQVCPTEAIVRLDLEEKHKVRIGLAAFDTTRCIPYAYGRDCMVCEEHCPIPDKAIYAVEVEVPDRSGGKKIVKQPRVDPDKCIGCGVCENVCPFKDSPGIHVYSANESRHPGNQPILPEDSPY